MDLIQKKEKRRVVRLSTGIKELDEKMGGGIPKGFSVIITGPPGSGKTIFTLQCIVNAVQRGEHVLFISSEQYLPGIIDQALQFNWDLEEMVQENKLKLECLDPWKLYELNTMSYLKDLIYSNNWDLIVIDSINSLAPVSVAPSNVLDNIDRGYQPDTFVEMGKGHVLMLYDLIRQKEITCLIIAQKDTGKSGDKLVKILEYRGDALIDFDAGSVGKTTTRTIQIKKMRQTKIELTQNNIDITDAGITIR
ncbi:MAG: ATPase domain-containing protein [Candidatus Thermoplasmatota archaeon]